MLNGEENTEAPHSEREDEGEDIEDIEDIADIEEEEEEEEAEPVTVPSDIIFDDAVFDVHFHPTHDLLAAALVSGGLDIYRYTLEQSERVFSQEVHDAACRSTRFSTDGNFLFSAGSDAALKAVDTNTLQICYNLPEAHDAAISKIACEGPMIFSGDDNGCVKVWDMRQRTCALQFHNNTDFISDMLLIPPNYLLCTSGDGTLSIFNIRRGKLEGQTPTYDDEFLSVAPAYNNNKIICGSQDGALYYFNWKEWDEISTKIPGHPDSVECMLPIDHNTILTGSSDGLLRVVQIRPNKMLGIVGEHKDFPIERMALSASKAFLATCSHDETIKFWDVGYLFEDEDEDEDEGEEAGAAEESSKRKRVGKAVAKEKAKGKEKGKQKASEAKGKGKSKRQQDSDDDDDDDDDDRNDSNDMEDEEEEEPEQRPRPKRRGFFADL